MSTLTSFRTIEGTVFIETGTGRAETLRHAAKGPFRVCHSIEQDGKLYQDAIRMFRKLKHVKVHKGLSVDVLPQIMDATKTTTFWLDAHQCGVEGWKGALTKPAAGPECPLLDELRLIAAVPWETPPIVCIDDAFLFNDETWDVKGMYQNLHRDQWPTLAQIEDALPTHEFIARDVHVLVGRQRATPRPAVPQPDVSETPASDADPAFAPDPHSAPESDPYST